MSSNPSKVTLRSSDGETFEVDVAVAGVSQVIKYAIEDFCADNGIPVPNVTSWILAKVIEYCEKHVETSNSQDRASKEDLEAWDADFVKVDQATLCGLMKAANYLEIKSLQHLIAKTLAKMMEGKTTYEIGKTFNIKNDLLTPEEQEKARLEYQEASKLHDLMYF